MLHKNGSIYRSYSRKNTENLTKSLDKVTTAPIIISDFGLRTSDFGVGHNYVLNTFFPNTIQFLKKISPAVLCGATKYGRGDFYIHNRNPHGFLKKNKCVQKGIRSKR